MDKSKEIRLAFAALREYIDQRGDKPISSPEQTYVPKSHARALDPETTLVEGIRGSGKSFWWSALSSAAHRSFLSKAFPNIRIDNAVDIVQGFGADQDSEKAPSSDTIESLGRKYSPRAIWRTVVATHAKFDDPFPLHTAEQAEKWDQRVSWVSSNPEQFDSLLRRADQRQDQSGRTCLILFDALDRLASQWDAIRPHAQALLQVALEMRSTRRIRLKLFVRPDMLEDRGISGFPDFSKLNAGKASLEWKRADLYALIFQRVGNSHIGGAEFRSLASNISGLPWAEFEDKWWVLPGRLALDEDLQEKVFIALAGQAMGSGASGYKRGKPYTWLVNHLQDGRNQVSPRSFLSAVGEAAEMTDEDNPSVFSARAIQIGVQQASKIRVDEFKNEDYPWVNGLMEALRGKLTVPCAVDDILTIWNENSTLKRLKQELGSAQNAVKLPPQHLDEGGIGVLQDLQELGLVQLQDKGRIQMPDVYRIAFGIGRRGGVKPVK